MPSWNKADVSARRQFVACVMTKIFLNNKMCPDITIFGEGEKIMQHNNSKMK